MLVGKLKGRCYFPEHLGADGGNALKYLDDWLTVHRSITLVDLQLDAQNSYLFIYI